VNAGQEASCGLVIAGGDGPELLELGEEVLDQMPGLVEVFVKGARCRPGLPRWDHGCLAGVSQRLEYPLVGIERLVGDERLGLKVGQQGIGSGQIVRLTAGQMKADRITKGIHQRVDLGGQPALAAADGLVGPCFLGAPAAC
jgi:hypothetical protein